MAIFQGSGNSERSRDNLKSLAKIGASSGAQFLRTIGGISSEPQALFISRALKIFKTTPVDIMNGGIGGELRFNMGGSLTGGGIVEFAAKILASRLAFPIEEETTLLSESVRGGTELL